MRHWSRRVIRISLAMVYPEVETEFDLVDRILERFNWISYQEKLKKEAE